MGPPAPTPEVSVDPAGQVDDLHLLRHRRQGASQRRLGGSHDRTSSSSSGASARSLAIALKVWLRTVPTEQPRASAAAVSLRSSKYRSTTTARCRGASCGEGGLQREGHRDLVVVTAGRQLLVDQLHLVDPVVPPPGDVLAVEDGPHVGLRVAARGDPGPAPGDLDQGGLHEILGRSLVPRQQVRRAQQRRRPGPHELGERRVVPVAQLHVVTACPCRALLLILLLRNTPAAARIYAIRGRRLRSRSASRPGAGSAG